ncbi:MAG: hypothetical protein EBR82_70050 [Caulobacteraceae bacterium]|nr:hypothetical protein [Caulobacteraceae bacterium]
MYVRINWRTINRITGVTMSPRLLAASCRAYEALGASLVLAMHDFDSPEAYAAREETARLIAERDDIALDESTLTPECIGQLMGGN